MELESLGWSASLQEVLEFEFGGAAVPARVAAIERGAAVVWSARGSVLAAYGGALAGQKISEVMGVGDWVALDASDRLLGIVSRRTSLVRRAAGTGAPQLVAANVDRMLVVTAVGGDFNVRRLERYLAVAHEGGVTPVVVVNKTDVAHDRDALVRAIDAVAPGVPVVLTSAIASPDRVAHDLAAHLAPGVTVALVGSSGVGKSTIVNRLCGEDTQETQDVRAADDKGRHTTTRREMFVTASGALVIDTPGMRELGLLDASDGLAATFADIEVLASACRFGDCAHAGEPGCAIANALSTGALDRARYDSYEHLRAEVAYESRRADARAARSSKKRGKEIARRVRERDRLNKKLGLKGS